MSEINYNEARVEVLKIKNLLRTFEKAEEVLQAAEHAEGQMRTYGPEVDRLKGEFEKWKGQAAQAKAEFEEASRRLAEARAMAEMEESKAEALVRRLDANAKKAEEASLAKMADMDRQAQEHHAKRMAAFVQEFNVAKADAGKVLDAIRSEVESEKKKLEWVKEQIRTAAARAAEMAGV